ncbi:MAG: 50S rRNA methyltransferase [Parachlamydiales bacterium]|nr:50S rRNA methyltransferase [Parachlamydiales bacterium]
MDNLFVTCVKGFEPLLTEELKELGFEKLEPSFCGVFVEGSFSDIYRINYCSRLASRVLMPLEQFALIDRDDLYEAARSIDWRPFFEKRGSVAIDVNGRHNAFTNSLYAAQIVKDAICDQLREHWNWRPNVDTKNPDVQLNVYLERKRATLFFDTSGDVLFKRGYRKETGEAPLSESFAAGLLKLAGYKGTEHLFDPCCGSGTFLIEAAMIATKTPPGYLRPRFGFFSHEQFDEKVWLECKNEADAARIPLNEGQISGIDISKSSVWNCRTNLRQAGFFDQIQVEAADFRDYHPSNPINFIIANPPHGKRMGSVEQLASLYRSLGDFMKQQTTKPARGFVFTSDMDLAKEVGLKPTLRHVVPYSNLDSRLLEYDLY